MIDTIIEEDQGAFEFTARKAVQNYRKREAPDPNLALKLQDDGEPRNARGGGRAFRNGLSTPAAP